MPILELLRYGRASIIEAACRPFPRPAPAMWLGPRPFAARSSRPSSRACVGLVSSSGRRARRHTARRSKGEAPCIGLTLTSERNLRTDNAVWHWGCVARRDAPTPGSTAAALLLQTPPLLPAPPPPPPPARRLTVQAVAAPDRTASPTELSMSISRAQTNSVMGACMGSRAAEQCHTAVPPPCHCVRPPADAFVEESALMERRE